MELMCVWWRGRHPVFELHWTDFDVARRKSPMSALHLKVKSKGKEKEENSVIVNLIANIWMFIFDYKHSVKVACPKDGEM